MTESNAFIEIQSNNFEIDAIQPLPITSIVRRRDSVVEIFQQIMKQDIHYGAIPGCGDKPVLLKPGAETICNTFQVAPEYTINKSELPNGHREYEIICNLYTINGNRFVGSGIGSSTTMESKHRWRNDFENTGEEVPKAYWNHRDISLIGGKGFSPKKVDGVWMIHRSEGKIENPDPADCYNTVLKMGKKRAYVDAVISTFGVSDLFTQDLEENISEEKPQQKTIKAEISADPNEAKKKIIKAFAAYKISPEMLAEYLEHSLDSLSVDEIAELRTIHQSIRDGNTTWKNYQKKPEENGVPSDTKSKFAAKKPEEVSEPKTSLNDVMDSMKTLTIQDVFKSVNGKKKEFEHAAKRDIKRDEEFIAMLDSLIKKEYEGKYFVPSTDVELDELIAKFGKMFG